MGTKTAILVDENIANVEKQKILKTTRLIFKEIQSYLSKQNAEHLLLPKNGKPQIEKVMFLKSPPFTENEPIGYYQHKTRTMFIRVSIDETLRRTLIHEVGHAIHWGIFFSSRRLLKSTFQEHIETKHEIENYGLSNPMEFFAVAFENFFCNSHPRICGPFKDHHHRSTMPEEEMKHFFSKMFKLRSIDTILGVLVCFLEALKEMYV